MKAKILSVLNRILFFSNRKHCPVCESNFFSFIPLPPEYEENWKRNGFPYVANDFETLNAAEFSCPVCGSTDRDRIFASYLKTQQQLPLSHILDIAPSGALSRWIRKNLNVDYKTADLFMKDVDYKVDIEDMNTLPGNHFDLVICSHVLEHVPNDMKAISEISRILKPGGQAILMVPIVKGLSKLIEDPEEKRTEIRWKKFGQDDHIRLYSANDFIERIESSGLKVKPYQMSDLNVNCYQYGINPGSVLYIATK